MTARPRTAVILLNPAARKAARFDAARALRRLDTGGVDGVVRAPASVDAFVSAAREAVEAQADLVFVAGGDGALRLAAGEAAGSATALAPIPLGTANVWAREIGLPSHWERAIDAHVGGQRVAMDLGRAGDEPFLLMAGIGWDAAIAARVSPGLKRRLGPGAYVAEAARALPRLRSSSISLELDGQCREFNAGMLVIGNTRLYGGVVEFTPGAMAGDGLFDVCIAGPRRPGQGTVLAARLAGHRLRESDALHFTRMSQLGVTTPGIPVQLDGDVVGETPMRFTLEPHGIQVSIPSGPLPPIFTPADIVSAGNGLLCGRAHPHPNE